MFGAEPYGSVPFGYVKDAGVASKLQQAVAADDGHVFLVEFKAKQIGAADEILLRYSTTGYVSPNLTGHPNDNVSFDRRVLSAYQLSRTLPIAPEAARRLAINIGSVELINSDENFDALFPFYAVDGRDITVKFGLNSYAYKDFATVFSGSIIKGGISPDVLTLTVQDNGYKLDRPLQTNLYGGTGGADGAAQIKNQPKPICLQYVQNETPVFIDPSNLVWQIHDGTISSVIAVRDKGAALAFVADYADYTTLTGASLSTGQYATCLALGMIRLGGQPAGTVTFDAIGGVFSASSTTPSADVVMSILKTFGSVDDADINLPTWQALEHKETFDSANFTGIFFANPAINISDALNQYLASIFWYWGCDQDGRYSAHSINYEGVVDTGIYFAEADIRDIEIVEPFDGTFPPRWRQQIAYNRIGVVQPPNDLAGSVSASNVQKYGLAYNLQITADTSVKDDFITAFDPPILISPYVKTTLASPGGLPPDRLADRIMTLLSVQNTSVRVDVGKAALAVQLGTNITINHSRIRSGEDWMALVVDIDIDEASNKYDLYLFGEVTAPTDAEVIGGGDTRDGIITPPAP